MLPSLSSFRSHRFSRKGFGRSAFTLIEVVVVVAILAILCVAVAYPAFMASKRSVIRNSRWANCKTLTDAVQRVQLAEGIVPGIVEGNPGRVAVTGLPPKSDADYRTDTQAAYNFYIAHNLLRGKVNLDGVVFIGGEWKPVNDDWTPWTGSPPVPPQPSY